MTGSGPPGPDTSVEWLEADGLGGFASGTAGGVRTRRYHALLLAATRPPAGRGVLANGVEAWVETPASPCALTTQRHAPDLLHPDGWRRIAGFARDPWPTWTFALPDGIRIVHEVLVARDACETILRWRRAGGDGPCALRVRPLLSGRDYHALQRENAALRFGPVAACGGNVAWRSIWARAGARP